MCATDPTEMCPDHPKKACAYLFENQRAKELYIYSTMFAKYNGQN
jgi:hypothetical protein